MRRSQSPISPFQMLSFFLHRLQDMMGAPPWTWFLTAAYLAGIHNQAWNKEKSLISITARDGITRDRSRLLQFVYGREYCILTMKALFLIRKNVHAILLVVLAMLVMN